MEGYIKLYRKLTEHPLWADKPFSKGQAWIDLLLAANHTQTRFYLGRSAMTAEAGQVVTSEVKLAARWGWSRQKVRDFLKALSSDGMLVKASNRKRTVLTLCNYSDYNTPRISGTVTAASEPSGTDFW
jgi:DNA replication protein DnaD